MAAAAEEEEYESDPDEAKPSLAMRRRQASDDEEEEEDGERAAPPPRTRSGSRLGIGSGEESDGQGGVEDYSDEGDGVDDDEVGDDGYYVEYEEEVDCLEGEGFVERAHGGAAADTRKEFEWERGVMAAGKSLEEGDDGVEEAAVVGEKKEKEPFAVPTSGAFYMHDDRFRNNGAGKHRRTLGGRRLWESKDDRKWGHDKFEELALQERGYGERKRNFKDQYRVRGWNRRAGQDYLRGNRTTVQASNHMLGNAPKDVRGRGPRRYVPLWKTNEPLGKNRSKVHPTQSSHAGKFFERSLQTSSQKLSVPTANRQSNLVPAKNQVSASSLSAVSPPFYPSSSSNKEATVPQKINEQAGSVNRNSVPQSSALLRGKNIVDIVRMDKLYIDDSIPPFPGKLRNTRSVLNITTQSFQPNAKGRGLAQPGKMPFEPSLSYRQSSRAQRTQSQAAQRNPVQNRGQSSVQSPAQVLGELSTGGLQSSSPPKPALSMSSFESGEESPESSKSKTALVGKGRGVSKGGGRHSFIYSGAQVMGASGNMAVGHGDQKLPATSTFLPVMLFGGQHSGGVPAVGMEFPGYAGQPQLGLGKSEMAWLPVLAGTGGLGATYRPPYFALDGSYHVRPSGQTSAVGPSSKDTSTSKPHMEQEASQRPEILNDEYGQRHNKSRRYSEMSFGH